MGRGRWRPWVGVLAIAVGGVATQPALAEGPQGNAPETAVADVEEANRLAPEMGRLFAQGKYDEAISLAKRILSAQEKALGPDHPNVAIHLYNVARLHSEKGDYARAEPLYLRALAIQEKTLGRGHTDIAQTVNNLALLYHQKGDYARSEPLYQRALTIWEKALGPDHPDVATALNNLAALYVTKGDYARAEPLHLRALAIWEKVLGPDHLDVATALNNLASVSYAKGDYGRTELLIKRAVAIWEKALGPDHPDVATALNNLAALYVTKGDYARAEPLHLRALAIREKALGPDHPDLAISLNKLAALYSAKGDYARAEPLHLRAIAIVEKALGPDHTDVANALNNLAVVYHEKGDYARAEPLYQRSLAIHEKALGANHPHVAYSLNNLAQLYFAKRELARAEPLFQRSLAIRQKVLGPDHTDVAASLNNLALLYKDKGDLARAEPLFQRALTIRENALGPAHTDVATSFNNLAVLYEAKGDDERAEALYQRALIIQEKALGSDHPNVADPLNNLAGLYYAKGDLKRAEPLFERSIAIREKALGPDHPDLATSINNLAVLHTANGDHARAEPLYQRGLAIVEKALGPDHPGSTGFLRNLAWLYIAQARPAEALTTARRAIDIVDRNTATLLTTGSEEQKRLYMATLLGETSGYLSMHVQHAPSDPDAARLALTVLLRRKGRVLDAMTDSLAALRRSLAPGDRELLTRLAAVYSQLATQISHGPGKASPESYRKDLAARVQERQTLEADVSQRSAAFRAEQRLVTVADVQAKIPEGAALVEIARYRPFRPRTGSQPAPRSALRYVAYVLRPSGDPTFADLGEAAPLEAAVGALRSALGDHDRSHDPKPAARALDRLLMQPIRKLLGDTRWVFLSPDGPLHLVPFGALVDEQGHYLVERYLFSYLTTARDLLRFGDARPAPREAPLVLANPAFNDGSALPGPEATRRGLRSIDMITQSLPSLESTVEEAETIARLFPKSRVLLGAKATEEAVKAAKAPLLMHLATHGFFLPEQPVPEALLRNPGGEPTSAERAALLQRENPLVRSGIALAGFNRRRSGSDDGVLTALEVAGLDLYGTRLVVLSTCESGVGEASSGEGVYGLRRALTMAGSETQVMSLWQVDTGRTRELMQAYYQQLTGGSGRSEAIREVQLSMLANPATAHPNLWASFIVSGEWRTMEGQPRVPEAGKVSPSARGCACDQAGGPPREESGWRMVALGLVATGRRRRPGRLRAPDRNG